MNLDELYIGLISGTSMDAIDCALVSFAEDQPRLIASRIHPLDEDLRTGILALCEGKAVPASEVGRLDASMGSAFAGAVCALLEDQGIPADRIRAIGSHGQTVWHEPGGDLSFSMQLGDPNRIAETTGIGTVADFRRRDMAAGGQGAPLAPLLHRACFMPDTGRRGIVNIGGIANLTVLSAAGPCMAFDTGPGNLLLDYWTAKHRGEPFDRGGSWAAGGKCSQSLLESMLGEAYFEAPPPKSTGRELFNAAWLERHLAAATLTPADVQASLAELTAATIAEAARRFGPLDDLHVCGGGSHNAFLLERLAANLPGCAIDTTAALGMDPDMVEAVCFAWLAKQALESNYLETGCFTGAGHPVVLGGVFPGGKGG